jgi:predicted aspartyl protease
LAKIIGSVDDLGRPIIRIEAPGRDGLAAVVDTGFNRSLLLLAADALSLGFSIKQKTEIVELGTTERVTVRRASGEIFWLGKTLRVEALISNEPTPIYRPDTARALIGTELLSGTLLLVDFASRLVEIETQ